jgi:hypothetical protein
VELGTILHVKYQLVVKDPQLDKFFSEVFYFGSDELVTKYRIDITLELPLNILINDFKKNLLPTS